MNREQRSTRRAARAARGFRSPLLAWALAACWSAGCGAPNPSQANRSDPAQPSLPRAAEPEAAALTQPSPVDASEESPASLFGDEDAHDGPWLYARNCSGCHGISGAGDGETAKQLGVAPRNFNQGGFSFGNTREAIFRTVSSGIPGRSVMPSFAGTLTEEERWLIVDHVLALVPDRGAAEGRGSVLSVGTRPTVARGKLPPVAEGLSELPRGLLVGLPEGMTFEYDVEDVRLVAVRLGEFCDRQDWRDRGGSYLAPLGQAIYRLDTRSPGAGRATCASAAGAGVLRGELRGTLVQPDAVEVRYDWTSPLPAPGEADRAVQRLASVRERVSFRGTPAGPAFVRAFEVTGEPDAGAGTDFAWALLGAPGTPVTRVPIGGSSPIAWWITTPLEEGLSLCALLRRDGPAGQERVEFENPLRIRLARGETLRFTLVGLVLSDTSTPNLDRLAQELLQ